MNLNKLKGNIIAFDTETTGLMCYGDFKRWGFYPARPFAFSFCDTEGNTVYIRWKVDPKTRQVLTNARDIELIKGVLENPDIAKIGHNLGYDIRMCKAMGINVKGGLHDTLILAHVITGGDEFSYGLKQLAEKYLEFSASDEKDLRDSTKHARIKGKQLGWRLADKDHHGKDPIKADYWMADPKLCEKYAIQDAERTMLFYMGWKEKIEKDPDIKRVYDREMKLFRVVSAMEDRGTRVFPEDVSRLRKFYQDYMDKQKKTADENGGKGMNFKSAKQKNEIFFNVKKYKPMYFTKNGNPSVNGDTLLHFAKKYDDKLARAIMEYVGASHVITGFLNPYERFRVAEDSKTWVLHPNYRQCGPVTGRFSCGDPNLMQVASPNTGRKRTEISMRPRECFGPRDGYVWYLPDYSQIEIWVFSFLAQEKAMMEALLSGRDFHGAVAEQVWGHTQMFKEDFDHARKRAKLLMFCKLYGGGTKKVAYLTDSTVQEAQAFVDDFNSKLPGVDTFMTRMINRAERDGKIVNPFGRTYYIQQKFSYKAVNYLVQGTSADILKSAMIRIHEMFQTRWKGCHLLLTLHDELIIEVPLEYHSKMLMREIIAEMQADSALVNCPVPLPVGMKIAPKRWSETIEIDSLKKEWKDKYICKTTNSKDSNVTGSVSTGKINPKPTGIVRSVVNKKNSM